MSNSGLKLYKAVFDSFTIACKLVRLTNVLCLEVMFGSVHSHFWVHYYQRYLYNSLTVSMYILNSTLEITGRLARTLVEIHQYCIVLIGTSIIYGASYYQQT